MWDTRSTSPPCAAPMPSTPRPASCAGAMSSSSSSRTRPLAIVAPGIWRGTADGRVLALDAQTRGVLWRFEPTLGRKFGGGFWTTYSLDPETGEVFGGVANPYPDFNRDLRKNDALYTVYTNSGISRSAE